MKPRPKTVCKGGKTSVKNKLKQGKFYTFEAKHTIGTNLSLNHHFRAQRRLQESFTHPPPKDEPLWLRVDRLRLEVCKHLSTKALEREDCRERGSPKYFTPTLF